MVAAEGSPPSVPSDVRTSAAGKTDVALPVLDEESVAPVPLKPVVIRHVDAQPAAECLDAVTSGSITHISPLTTTMDGRKILDARVGLVVSVGDRHFDRTNRRHPEQPSRITSILSALTERGLWERCHIIDFSTNGPHLPEEDYLRVHLLGHMQRLQRLSTCLCLERLDREARQYHAVYLTRESVQEARKAASALCQLTERVIASWCIESHVDDEALDHGFAIVRPPGHHAEPGLAGGYCFVNNVALAAVRALAYRHGSECAKRVRRVCIVDWDVHHGNGTQAIFYSDPCVLYFSVHLYMAGTFYPHTGRHDDVGSGSGAGKTVNVAWSRPDMGDDEYLAVWEILLLPMLTEFDPDLVLVSAGFDAAKGDVGNCQMTPHGFATLTRRMKETLRETALAKTNLTGRGQQRPAPIICTLEGGYTKITLGLCVAAVVETLLHDGNHTDALFDDVGSRPITVGSILDNIHPSAAQDISHTMDSQQPYWNFLSKR